MRPQDDVRLLPQVRPRLDVRASGFPGEWPGPAGQRRGLERLAALHRAVRPGLSVNAIQAAGVFQTIANDGVRIPPRLVDAHDATADGNVHAADAGPGRPGGVAPRRPPSVREMLEGVVSRTAPPRRPRSTATASPARPAPRTATTPRSAATAGCTASFIGYAPADDPQIVVAVTLQQPDPGLFGGCVAGPGVQGRHDLRAAGAADPADRHQAARWSRSRLDPTPGLSDPTVLRDRHQRSRAGH